MFTSDTDADADGLFISRVEDFAGLVLRDTLDINRGRLGFVVVFMADLVGLTELIRFEMAVLSRFVLGPKVERRSMDESGFAEECDEARSAMDTRLVRADFFFSSNGLFSPFLLQSMEFSEGLDRCELAAVAAVTLVGGRRADGDMVVFDGRAAGFVRLVAGGATRAVERRFGGIPFFGDLAAKSWASLSSAGGGSTRSSSFEAMVLELLMMGYGVTMSELDLQKLKEQCFDNHSVRREKVQRAGRAWKLGVVTGR